MQFLESASAAAADVTDQTEDLEGEEGDMMGVSPHDYFVIKVLVSLWRLVCVLSPSLHPPTNPGAMISNNRNFGIKVGI